MDRVARGLTAALVLVGCGRRDSPLDDLEFASKADNVLILFLDDVGTDQVGSWGDHPDPSVTPTLDQLAERGVAFHRAWSAPVCSPARAALLTGRYARRTGLGDLIETGGDQELSTDATLLPEVVAEAGWSTAAIGKWDLAGAEVSDWRHHPNASGFDHFAGTPGNVGEPYDPASGKTDHYRWERNEDGELSIQKGWSATVQVDDALAWIADQDGPWLTYLAFSAAHAPFQAPPKALLPEGVRSGDTDRERFAAMVSALDTELGRLFAEMDPEVLARTQIVAMGDNGTPGEVVKPPWDGEQAKYTLYEGGIRVPLIVAGAGVKAEGSRSDALVSVVDLFPTAAGIADRDPGEIDGLDLAPLLADPEGPWPREVLFADRFGPIGPPPGAREQIAARDDRFKLLVTQAGGAETSRELFDLDGRLDDGPDLLLDALDAEAQAAHDRLDAAIAEFRTTPYEGH